MAVLDHGATVARTMIMTTDDSFCVNEMTTGMRTMTTIFNFSMTLKTAMKSGMSFVSMSVSVVLLLIISETMR